MKSLIILVLSVLLLACEGNTPKQKDTKKTYKVQPSTLHKTLFFTGAIQPLAESTLTSPVNAVVETMRFQYGQYVKKDEIIATLNSPELEKQYNDALTDYLKAKDSFMVAKAKFAGTNDLWQSGLLSKNNYLNEKSSLDTARVTLIQSTRKLSELIEKMDDGTKKNFSSLTLAEFDKVRQALTTKHDLIHLRSSRNGVLLYPPKTSDDNAERLSIGSSVKSGQVVALIGDLSGIRVEIDVPEVDVDKIKIGMPATIRGVAFSREELKGELITINAQASTNSTGSLPSFKAVVEVKQLTPSQQKWIKVGMSASIELSVDSSNQLLIPISAVKYEKAKRIVLVRTTNDHFAKRTITTGPAQADQVVVESGLKAGEVVMYE